MGGKVGEDAAGPWGMGATSVANAAGCGGVWGGVVRGGGGIVVAQKVPRWRHVFGVMGGGE